MKAHEVKKELREHSEEEKAKSFPHFFKTGKEGYAENDRFIGVTVPNQRKVAKKYKELPLGEVQKLLRSKIHEERLTALLILTYKFEKANDRDRISIKDFYLMNTKWVNNWDLVDSSAHKILGRYLLDMKDRKILYELARSKDLWERRISIVATWWFIRDGQLNDTFKLSEILLGDEHDLIHKAVGWMLREAGQKDHKWLEDFLKKHYKTMPRTMLRYSIEKFSENTRKRYLEGKI